MDFGDFLSKWASVLSLILSYRLSHLLSATVLPVVDRFPPLEFNEQVYQGVRCVEYLLLKRSRYWKWRRVNLS